MSCLSMYRKYTLHRVTGWKCADISMRIWEKQHSPLRGNDCFHLDIIPVVLMHTFIQLRSYYTFNFVIPLFKLSDQNHFLLLLKTICKYFNGCDIFHYIYIHIYILELFHCFHDLGYYVLALFLSEIILQWMSLCIYLSSFYISFKNNK